ncbi:hypothetical protein PSCFBP3800_00137 [Pseudomonas syringae group genomosp. 3]|uniref:Uncharacterized protein n=1 Tax=Pseudomonas syringae pv. persicae TaxID=237306 RepID=A0A3M4AR79_9PSED|nr:hypothetical protein ALQ30_200280 [Pseudomonas syringae pv. persicae]SPF10209.1 hypothetical protein PSCFBP3800_00137 [Pseudomonas syringae group genomosp. 3]
MVQPLGNRPFSTTTIRRLRISGVIKPLYTGFKGGLTKSPKSHSRTSPTLGVYVSAIRLDPIYSGSFDERLPVI